MSGPENASRSSARPLTRRGEETRERILDAAARAFAEVGFRRTRLEDVAAGAGVSRTLLYAYFESKEHLLQEVRDGVLADWAAAVGPSVERAGSAAETLEAMVRGTLAYARTRPFLGAVLSDDARVVLLDRDDTNRSALEGWRKRLVDALQGGVASGEFRADLDVGATADVLRAMQVGMLERMHRAGPIEVGRDAHVDAALALVLGGVRRT